MTQACLATTPGPAWGAERTAVWPTMVQTKCRSEAVALQMNQSDLEHVFTDAAYQVSLDDAWLTLTIGNACPETLAAWLRAHGNRTGWVITACNPGAKILAPGINAARNRALHDWTDQHGLPCLESINVDPDGQWPDEPGLLIGDLEEGLARVLAQRFGQFAIVAAPPDRPVDLLWLSPA